MLGLEGAELSRRQEEVEAALSGSSILPVHRAMLGTAFTQFRSVRGRNFGSYSSAYQKVFEVSITLSIAFIL